MPCPWYQRGVCTSPKLGTPTDVVVSPHRCLSDDAYRSCAYYVDPSAVNEKRRSPPKEQLKVYAPIHALVKSIEIRCPYAQIIKLENGIEVAYCHVLGRLLTRYEAELCAKHGDSCPYRAIASALRT